MTDLRKAAEMALDALEKGTTGLAIRAIPALRQALAQPEQKLIGWKDGEPQYVAQPEQEPVAYMGSAGLGYDKNKYLSIPLYTAPPKPEQESISTNKHLCAMLRQVHDVLACTALPMKRPWVGLTDDEIHGIIDVCTPDEAAQDELNDFAKAIFAAQAKLKEKNNAV